MDMNIDISIGQEIDGYIIERPLGAGSFNSVFSVRTQTTGARAALKLLRRGEAEAKQRFKQEIAALKQLNHPDIPKYIHDGTYNGQPFLVQTFVPGESLRKQLYHQRRQGRTCGERQVLIIVRRLLGALAHMHEHNIVHRDVKDANVVVSKSLKQVSLVDLGFCREIHQDAKVESFTQIGALRFGPPKKLRSPTTIHDTHDVFAVGVLAYVLLTNCYPWDLELGDDVSVLIFRMETRPLVPVSDLNTLIHPELSNFVSVLLAVDDDNRPDAAAAKHKCDSVYTSLRKERRAQSKQPTASLDRLWSIGHSSGQVLSTRRVGSFPQHLTYVRDLVDRARTKIRMMVDCVDHGSFLDPKLHDELLRTIERVGRSKHRPAIQLLICGKGAAISKSNPFFAVSYARNRKNIAFVRCLSTFCIFHRTTRPGSKTEFHKLLMRYHTLFKHRLLEANVDIRNVSETTAKSIGYFCWIEDERYAIFGPAGGTTFFRTHDSILVKSLITLFDFHWQLRPKHRKH
jgi:hypothetical protein